MEVVDYWLVSVNFQFTNLSSTTTTTTKCERNNNTTAMLHPHLNTPRAQTKSSTVCFFTHTPPSKSMVGGWNFLGWPIFRGELLVSGSVVKHIAINNIRKRVYKILPSPKKMKIHMKVHHKLWTAPLGTSHNIKEQGGMRQTHVGLRTGTFSQPQVVFWQISSCDLAVWLGWLGGGPAE